jgi:para-nitrobenzyl esterase
MRRPGPIRGLSAALFWLSLGATGGCGVIPQPPGSPDAATRRAPPAGELVGTSWRYDSHAWLGIPYAEPPVGERRWRAPEAAARWSGEREAVELGAICTQLSSRLGGEANAPPGTLVGDEDCLTLNVFAPRFAAEHVPRGEARLPVMVWIHGGGNTVGAARFYDGGNLAASQNVVVVAINYRLGPFGWFRHESLRGDGASADDRSGNFGTLDIVRALHWVRDNIGAFGGDPGNVTIFGESAGGKNVFTMLLSSRANGLFHRAVSQSGVLETDPPAVAENPTDAEVPGALNGSGEVLLRLLVADGRAEDRNSARALLDGMKSADVASYLRSKAASELMAVYVRSGDGEFEMPEVFADGDVLPSGDALAQLGRRGSYNQVPVMLGSNRDENKLFLIMDPLFASWWFDYAPRLRDERRFEVTAEFMSRMWKATAVDEPARAMRAVQGPSVFAYRFDWDEEPRVPLIADLSRLLGAAHGFEIPFVFGHWQLGGDGGRLFDRGNEAGRHALSEQMMSYWAQFAYAGSPGRGRAGTLTEWTAWPAEGEAGAHFILLDTPESGGLRMSSATESTAALLSAIEADPRLPSPRERCRLYRKLADWRWGLSAESYPEAGRGECAKYPFDEYPWES